METQSVLPPRGGCNSKLMVNYLLKLTMSFVVLLRSLLGNGFIVVYKISGLLTMEVTVWVQPIKYLAIPHNFKIYLLPWSQDSWSPCGQCSACDSLGREQQVQANQFRMDFDIIISIFIYIQNVQGFFNPHQTQYSKTIEKPWPYFRGQFQVGIL